MPHFHRTQLCALLLLAICIATGTGDAQGPVPPGPDALVKKIQSEMAAALPPEEGKPDASVPHGEFLHGAITDSKIFPGTENGFEVYVQLNTIRPRPPV